jgi:hypothetical protein
MSGVSGEISIGERNPPKGRAAQDFTLCRLSILAKEETRLLLSDITEKWMLGRRRGRWAALDSGGD